MKDVFPGFMSSLLRGGYMKDVFPGVISFSFVILFLFATSLVGEFYYYSDSLNASYNESSDYFYDSGYLMFPFFYCKEEPLRINLFDVPNI